MIPRRHLFLLGALAVLGIWSALTIRLQTELLPLFPQDLPSVRGLEASQKAFATDREIMVVVTFPPGTGEPAKYGWLRLAREKIAKLPGVEMVSERTAVSTVSPERMAAWLIARLPPESFQKFQQLLTAENAQRRLKETRDSFSGAADPESMALLRRDPLRISSFLEEETGLKLESLKPPAGPPPFDVLVVRSSAPLLNFESCQRFTDSIHGVFQQSEFTGYARVLLTGRPAFVAETSRQMKTDMIRMILIAVILVSLAFWIFYRSLAPLCWILLLQTLAMLSGLIAARLVFGELNVLSMGFASIILGVGMDYCILVYHHHLHAKGNLRDPLWKPLRRSIWLSAFTTAGSFGILLFSSFPGFRQLALLIAIGLLATAYLATSVLPALLANRKYPFPAWIDPASETFAGFIDRNRSGIRLAFIAGLAAGIALFLGLGKVQALRRRPEPDAALRQ